ncbi:MAG: response regulator [Reichenbachiella sp.]
MNIIDKSSYSILLVDDDSVCNFITKTHLHQHGFDAVSIVENGKEAFDYVTKNEPPNLIFLDLNMPIMDGFEFLEELMDTSACPNTDILILTSSAKTDDVQVANSYDNVVAYLEKPLTEAKVTNVVENIMR